MANGFLMPRYGGISLWYVVGSSLTLIGTALMCKYRSPLPSPDSRNAHRRLLTASPHTDTVDDTTINPIIYGSNILIGTGTGCYIVAGFAIVQSLLPQSEVTNAVSAMAICSYPTYLICRRKHVKWHKLTQIANSPRFGHGHFLGD